MWRKMNAARKFQPKTQNNAQTCCVSGKNKTLHRNLQKHDRLTGRNCAWNERKWKRHTGIEQKIKTKIIEQESGMWRKMETPHGNQPPRICFKITSHKTVARHDKTKTPQESSTNKWKTLQQKMLRPDNCPDHFDHIHHPKVELFWSITDRQDLTTRDCASHRRNMSDMASTLPCMQLSNAPSDAWREMHELRCIVTAGRNSTLK